MSFTFVCRAKKIDAAKKIKAMMEEKGEPPNPITYGAILVAMSKERLPLEVEKLFLEMRNKGLKAGPFVWRYVIEAFVRSNQMDKAFILVDQMILEGVPVKGALKNILVVHCTRKNKLGWYTQRFGEVPKKEEVVSLPVHKGSHLKKYDKAFEDPRLDWGVDGDGLSIVSEARKKREEDESKYAERLKSLESEFLKEPLQSELHDAMIASQQKLSTKKRRERILPDYQEPKKNVPKKKKPVKKPDPNALPKKPKKRRPLRKPGNQKTNFILKINNSNLFVLTFLLDSSGIELHSSEGHRESYRRLTFEPK